MNYINVPFVINDVVEPVEGMSFDVTGIAGPYANEFTSIYWYYYTGSRYWELRAGGTAIAKYDANEQIYKSTGEPFICKGGDDLQNPTFIEWLEENANQSNDGIVLVTKYQMQYTADKIRAKRGTESSISWSKYSGFGDEINSIYVGNDTRDGTAFPFDIAEGAVAYSQEVQIIGTIHEANGVSF